MNKNNTASKIVLMVAIVLGVILFGGLKSDAHAQVVSGPTIPGSLSATVNQSNQVYVSWAPSTETSTNVVGYYLYRNGKLIANTPGYTFYTDSVPAGLYEYSVAAYDTTGLVSPQSAPTPYVTVLADNQPPTAPGNLTAISSSSSVSLSWDASTDNFGVIGYYIYRNGQKFNNTTTISGTSYLDSNLPEGNTYTYTVYAYDAVGNMSQPSNSVTAKTIFDVLPPSAPQGVIAKAVSPTEIDLSWKPATDNVQVSGYDIWRDGADLTLLPGTSTVYDDTSLSAGTSHTYYVYAYDEVGNTSIQGPGASATTFPPDVTPPSIPKNLYATPISSSQVTLTWSSSTDNVGVAGYNVFNGTTQVGTTASTTYTDTNLASNTTYQYFVSAYDTSGNVSPQTSVAVKTLSYDPVIVATTTPITPVTPTSTGTTSTDTSTTPFSPTTPTTPSTPTTGPGYHFSTNLYYGSRGAAVTALQQYLIQQGDLGAAYGTGFYGLLTQKAVQTFQCAQNLVCSGRPATTGWGSIGPRTRALLNSL